MTPNNRLAKLRSTIDRAAQCYYYSTPIVDDVAYDALIKELERLAPDDLRLTRVGYPVPPDGMLKKFKHTTFTGSLEKCNDEASLIKWYKTVGGSVVTSLKLDGNSLILYYESGQLKRAVTRGGDDGVGEDVTANAMRMKGVPSALNFELTCAVRGEAILSVSEWLKIDPDRAGNPRNVGSGMLRRVDGAGAETLEFLAFDLDVITQNQPIVDGYEREVQTEADKIDFISRLGFNVAQYRLCDTLEAAIASYKEAMVKRPTMDYWIDGIVFKCNDLKVQKKLGVSHNRPRAQRVLKFEAEGAETTLLAVTVTMGHTGALIPTATLEPVRIGGTTVSSALLNNFDEIADLDVAVGDRVRVIKANDIIPKIIEVIERPESRQPIVAPTVCPVCGGKVGRRTLTKKRKTSQPAVVYAFSPEYKALYGDGPTNVTMNVIELIDGRVLECKNKNCEARVTARLKTFIKKVDIQGIGDGVLEALIEAFGASSPGDLYRLADDPEALSQLTIGVGRLGQSRAVTICNNVKDKAKLSLNLFMGSLGIPHLGRRRVQLIREAVPGQFDTVADWRSGKLLDLAAQAGVPNVAKEIMEAIEAFAPVFDDMERLITIEEAQKMTTAAKTDGKLAGRTFVFTGKIEKVGDDGKRLTRDRLHELVLANGGQVADDVRAGTTDLVQADPSSQSSKSVKAKKLGINVMAESAFFAEIGE